MFVKQHPEAEEEVNEAVKYYESQSYGLGARFWQAYLELTEKLIQHPELHPFIYNETRWAKIDRFPYKVIYQIDGDLLKVIAVAQVKKRPHYWSERKWA